MSSPQMNAYLLITVLTVSFVASAFCWRIVLKSNGTTTYKVVGFLVSTIPIVGPVFFGLMELFPRNRTPYLHSHGSFFGDLSVEKLWGLLSSRRPGDQTQSTSKNWQRRTKK